MKLDRLRIRNYRNIEEALFEPSPGLNFLVGNNGQGKTSVLEAIVFFASLRSFRGGKTPEVIQSQKLHGELQADISDQGWTSQLRIAFELNPSDPQKGTKTAFINQKAYRSSSHYLTQRFGDFKLGFHAIVFNPSDHDLVRGDPAGRRSYLDRFISSFDLDYFQALQRYQRILDQRNALFKQYATSSRSPQARQLLLGFTEPMSQLASQIFKKRIQTLQSLDPLLNGAMNQIIPNGPKIRVHYESSWASEIIDNYPIISNSKSQEQDLDFAGHWAQPSLEQIERVFWKSLSSVEEAEWRMGHTLVGPQRDDWAFTIGQLPLRGHGSQGEVRSVLLSLKLAEVEWFKKSTGTKPLFLLDDFSSELDHKRRQFLLRYLAESDLQVFVTTTEDAAFEGSKFFVENGKIESANHDNLRQSVDRS